MAKRKGKNTFEDYECVFIGIGNEDLKVILKRQFVRYINEQYAYPVIAIK